jgi:hypothetical protein
VSEQLQDRTDGAEKRRARFHAVEDGKKRPTGGEGKRQPRLPRRG